MAKMVALDSSPLDLVSQRTGKTVEADACKIWMETLMANGVPVVVPEIADYEVRRELIRSGQSSGIVRLNALKRLTQYLPITTDEMVLPAVLWANVRNA